MTPDILMACTGAEEFRAVKFAPLVTASMDEFEIVTPPRQAAYLAQLGHESGGFQWMQEIWGPTPSQVRYEPPCSLAATLGNTQPGDGKRFKGRGPIQITGRFNYLKYGAMLGMDLVQFPELLNDPAAGCRVSAAFWKDRGLNELADAGDFLTITKRINGGTNGLPLRQALWARAKAALGVA